jgi:hypothetical protein
MNQKPYAMDWTFEHPTPNSYVKALPSNVVARGGKALKRWSVHEWSSHNETGALIRKDTGELAFSLFVMWGYNERTALCKPGKTAFTKNLTLILDFPLQAPIYGGLGLIVSGGVGCGLILSFGGSFLGLMVL